MGRLGTTLAKARYSTPQMQTNLDSTFRNIFMTPLLAQHGLEQGQEAGMKRQLMESQIASHVADAGYKSQMGRVAGMRADALGQAPTLFDSIVAADSGMTVPKMRQVRDQVETGKIPMGDVPGDPTADAPMVDTQVPAPFDPETIKSVFTQLKRYSPAMVNPSELRMNDMAQAQGRFKQMDTLDQVLADPSLAPGVGRAYAATTGKPLTRNIGNTGLVVDNFDPEEEATVVAPTLFDSIINQGSALVKQRNAAAGASGAAAGLSTARRDRVAGGYDKPVTVVDDESGTAEITRLPTGGEPVTVGTAAKKGTGVDATNAKERNRVTTAVEKEMVGAPDAEIAAEVERRMARRGKSGAAPAAAPATPAPSMDMTKANAVKDAFKAGKLTKEQARSQLQALGFK